ncbi:MAG: methyltransferase family protein [Methylocystis sp.]
MPDSDTDTSLAEQLNDIRRSKLYDLFAAAPFIAWCVYCATQILPALDEQIALAKFFIQTDPSVLRAPLILSILSNISTLAFLLVLVVVFAVRHVPRYTASGFYPRCVAAVATFLGVGVTLVPLRELSSWLYLGSLLLIIGGTVIAIWATLALGRSISIVPQARALTMRGPYSLVRHPLYLGEMVAAIGIALLHVSSWALLLVGLQFIFQFQRMKVEERMLAQVFPEYEDYMARTARLVPGVY